MYRLLRRPQEIVTRDERFPWTLAIPVQRRVRGMFYSIRRLPAHIKGWRTKHLLRWTAGGS